MRRILAVCLGFLLSATSLPAAAFETTQTATFFSDGRAIPFRYNSNLIALPAAADVPSTHAAVSTRHDFKSMGVRLTDVRSIDTAKVAPEEIVGIPVIFPESNGYGVLTKEILVRTQSAKDLALAAAETQAIDNVERLAFGDGIYRITYSNPLAAAEASRKIAGKAGIYYAHPNFLLPIEPRANPELEPFFPAQWNLENTGQSGGTPGSDINIKAAWVETHGSEETLVAVIDLGFEQVHPDLNEAWFINTREIPGNKIDDDGNGLKDDVSGWNYAINGTNLVYGQNPAHGTSTSGIIGARVNGRGTTGICPRCKILPIVIDAEIENAVAGFHYAKSFGAKVISNSWGYKIGTPRMDAVVDAINQTAAQGRNGRGTSIVFAMSNFGRNDCRGPEPDISSLDSVIAISSVDHGDFKVEASAYGPCMDFVAPTSGSTVNAVATTDRPGEKGYNRGENPDDFSDLDFTHTFYGTSAATPQVAGILALIYSLKPDLTSAEALAILKSSADKVHPDQAAYGTDGHSEMYGFGRINAGTAVEMTINR